MLDLSRRIDRLENYLWLRNRSLDDVFMQLSPGDRDQIFFSLVVDQAMKKGRLTKVPNPRAYQHGKLVSARLRAHPRSSEAIELTQEEIEEASSILNRYVKAAIWGQLAPGVRFPLD